MKKQIFTLILSLLTSVHLVFGLNPANVVIVRATSPTLTTDSNNPCTNGPRAAYIGFKVTNIGATTLTNLNISLGSFLPAVTFALTGGQAQNQYIGTLAPGASDILYWYITYPCVHNTACSVTATVNDGLPGVKTFTTTITTQSSISASAGGLINNNIWGAGAVVGQILYFDVIYSFGNANVGDTYNIQPCGNLDFAAGTFQFVNSEIISSVIPGIRVGARDSLYFVGGLKNGSSNFVTVRYFFQVMISNSPGTYCRPYASQTSGNQVKYTGNYAAAVLSPAPGSGAFPFVISLLASTYSANPCDTVNYRIVVRNTSSFPSSYSEIKASLPVYMHYIGIRPGSEVIDAMLMSKPTMGDTSSISWIGGVPSATFPYKEFFIPANDSLVLLFNAYVSCTAPVDVSTEATAIAYAGNDSSNIATQNICLNCTFPIELLGIDTKKKQNDIIVQWTSATEINSKSFEIERSLNNGLTFQSIGNVIAAGNSSTSLNYQYVDKDAALNNINKIYYRLKMVDVDGQFSYSHKVELALFTENNIYLNVYPNPTKGMLNVDFYIGEEDIAEFLVINALGEVIYGQMLDNKNVGLQGFTFDFRDYAAGVYVIQINTKKETITKRILAE